MNMEKDTHWEEWEHRQWELLQELGEEYYKTYKSIYNVKDKEWVLEDMLLKEKEEIAKIDFFRRL